MIFTAPLVLIGLAALPAVWFLLRLRPPRPRRIRFPPLELLRNLPTEQLGARRVPLWVLLLRLAAVALLILGLAGPSLHPPPALPGSGPVLLVIDNGWASAADWPERRRAAGRVIAAAAAAGRGVAILATAAGPGGVAPHIQGVMTAVAAGQVAAALQPEPWPVDRAAGVAALSGVTPATRIYIADGINDGPGFAAFMRALRPDRIFGGGSLPALLGAPLLNGEGRLVVKLLSGPRTGGLLARDAGGNVLARVGFDAQGRAVIDLPLPLANKIAVLALDGVLSAGGTVLLDGSSRSTLTGLAAAGNNADTPFLGAFYFIRRALPVGAQVITGNLAALTTSHAGVIILVDTPLDAAGQKIAWKFVQAGGVLVRFAGPLTAARPDPVAPDPLLAGDRSIGGALSWTRPLPLAAFGAHSPFAGIILDNAATVSRQVLADPVTLDSATVWAALSDGTPLVLGRRVGRGYLVSVLTSANTDWSSLAISGLYPALLARLTALGRGGVPNPNAVLSMQAALSAFGDLSPAAGPSSLTPAGLPGMVVSPGAPPGLYGAGLTTLALNLGGHIPPPVLAALSGAVPLNAVMAPVDFGGAMIGLAMLLLLMDLVVSLFLRGLLRWPGVVLACLLLPGLAPAQTAALQTELGYVRTGDPAADQISADGLAYISADVSAHSSAVLGDPVGLNPAVDDLGFYPLIYWPVLPAAAAPAVAACTALVDYMAHGGLLVIDTPGGDADAVGSGAGFAPGAGTALARVTDCLNLPPLVALTATDILAHCFYIVPDFSGRFTGAPVLIATVSARDADGVTPVIIGQNDWAGAWARDAQGNTEQTPIPGGDGQRVIADRFGTNLVIYALTGNYKADQTSAPALLDKLGQ